MHTHSARFHKIEAGEVWLAYLLYALFITAPAGALLSVAKGYHYRHLQKQTDSVEAEELERLASHCQWLNQTALVTLLLTMMAIGTAYYFFGYLFAVAAVVWWYYRIGRGAKSLYEHRAAPITG